MLSILIPVYNYDILPLVEEIHLQATTSKIAFEIIIIDDCSTQILFDVEKFKEFSTTKLIILKNNIGRSAIRNLLTTKANYNNLLFIDAGTFPKSKTFIEDYIKNVDKDIIVGGMIAEHLAPKKPYKLRWLYTKKRETCYDKNKVNRKIFTSANFLIKKHIIQSFPFDDNIKKYGFEDFIFFNTLKVNALKLHFINNPVIHDSKEDASTFIRKTKDGLENLIQLSQKNNDLLYDIKIIKLHSTLKTIGLDKVSLFVFKLIKALLIKNLNSSYPSLLLFDFYKLGYFCHLNSKN